MRAGLSPVPRKGCDFWRSLAWELVVRSSQRRARKNTGECTCSVRTGLEEEPADLE